MQTADGRRSCVTMRWITLVATAAALAPKDDKQLALWLLEPSRTIDEVRAGAETLAARPPTQPCDALALCMASWAASQKQQGDLLPKLAAKLAPRRESASFEVPSMRESRRWRDGGRSYVTHWSTSAQTKRSRRLAALRRGALEHGARVRRARPASGSRR